MGLKRNKIVKVGGGKDFVSKKKYLIVNLFFNFKPVYL